MTHSDCEAGLRSTAGNWNGPRAAGKGKGHALHCRTLVTEVSAFADLHDVSVHIFPLSCACFEMPLTRSLFYLSKHLITEWFQEQIFSSARLKSSHLCKGLLHFTLSYIMISFGFLCPDTSKSNFEAIGRTCTSIHEFCSKHWTEDSHRTEGDQFV